jgi:hypothetical protein
MRKVLKLSILAAAAYGAKVLYDSWRASQSHAGAGGDRPGRTGYDTPTGTDPHAKYAQPGYEDKSFGQAVNDDQQLVDRLVRESGGNLSAAEDRFRRESAGAPAIARQESDQA